MSRELTPAGQGAAEEGRVIGQEGRALGYTNIYTPELDVARDQRWGFVEVPGTAPDGHADRAMPLVPTAIAIYYHPRWWS